MRRGNGSLDNARAVPSMRTHVWVLGAHVSAKRAGACLLACPVLRQLRITMSKGK